MPDRKQSPYQKLQLLVIGSRDEFSLESRIFHSFSAIAFVVLPIQAIFNLAINLPIPALISTLVCIIQFSLYYLSRVKNKLNIAVILSSIEINILTSLNYFFNSGINGGTLLLFAISLFMAISVSQKKHWFIWISLNVGTVVTITCMEYFNAAIVKIHYTNREELFIDNVATYIFIIFILYVGTSSIRKNYIAQKQLADEKALALEMMNAEKDKLFSIISHDLRSPLSTLQTLFSIYHGGDIGKKELNTLLFKLEDTILTTGAFLDNLLEWSKNQLDGIVIKPVNFNLGDCIAENIHLAATKIDLKKLKVTNEVTTPAIVYADRNMINLVVRNLLSNSIKFCNPGDEIKFSTVQKDNRIIMAISDTGPGINEANIDTLFSLEHTLSAGTHGEKGNNLGLILCRDMVLQNQGSIHFETKQGEGTTFWIDLPGTIES